MEDTKLISLLAVNELKNYTLAAKKLNLTQPAISQHIRQLETELNIKIFNRVGAELKITPEGEVLVKYARRIVSMYVDLESRLKDLKRHSKTLTIGITHTAESNIVAEVLASYSLSNKGTKIKIISDTIKNLYDKLSTYEIDFAFVEGKVTEKKYSSILLDTDHLVAVMNLNNPLAKNKIIDINDLKREKMILRSKQSGTRSLFVTQLANMNMSIDEFNVIMEIDNIATIKDLIRKGVGVSVLPRSVCFSELKDHSLAILPIENVDMIREMNVVFVKDFVSMDILDDIISIYREMSI